MLKLTFASALSVALLAGTANAAVIVNGSFESGTPDAPAGGFSTLNAVNNTIDGWTVSMGSVDWINGYWEAQEGTHSIDLAGTVGGNPDPNGWIEQTFASTVGVLYTVTYWTSGNPDGGFDPGKKYEVAASLNGNVTQLASAFAIQGTDRQHMNWQQNIFQFTAQGAATTIRFASTENSQFGAAIDNISISPVPEPATWAMMIGGFGLVGGAMRRRRSSSRMVTA